MVSFGKLYINNPDIVNRVKNNYPLDYNFDMKYYYRGGETGYLDYPEY